MILIEQAGNPTQNLMSTRLNSPDHQGVVHFVTLNVRERKQAFRRDQYAQICVERLLFEADRHPAELLAFVVMPDHLHVLLRANDGEIKRLLSRFKPRVTLAFDDLCQSENHIKIKDWLWTKGKRELWQDSKYSLSLWNPLWLEQKISYIHQNPVRAGLVITPEEFRWSSYGAYVPNSGHTPPVRIDIYNPFD